MASKMLSATHTPSQLLIEEKPSVRAAAVGAIMIFFGAVFGLAALVRFSVFSWQQFVFRLLLWLLILGAGLCIVMYEPAKIMIDRRNRQVRLARRALFG